MAFQPGSVVYTQGMGSRPESVEVPHIEGRAPTSFDTGGGFFPVGKPWVNPVDNTAYVLTSFSSSGGVLASNWEETTSVAGVTLYPITPFVVGPSGAADYQTIQSAINACNTAGGGLVYIQKGAYIENLTIYSGITLQGNPSEQTTITGTHTVPDTGYMACSGLTFISLGDIFYSLDAGTANVYLSDCTFTSNGGYMLNLGNWASPGTFYLTNIISNGTSDSGYTAENANVLANNSQIGSGTGSQSFATGTTTATGCTFATGAVCGDVVIDSCVFLGSLIVQDPGSGTITHCRFSTGTQASIQQNSNTGVLNVNACVFDTTNQFVITGSGIASVNLNLATFLESSLLDISDITFTNDLVYIPHIQLTQSTLGIASLSSGTATVSTTAVSANSLIFLTYNTPEAVPGTLSAPVGSITPGTSFVINSTDATDSTSTVNWMIVEQSPI